jgi:hypothetical protein
MIIRIKRWKGLRFDVSISLNADAKVFLYYIMQIIILT